MKKLTFGLLFFFLFGFSQTSFSQSYQSAVGVRLGNYLGATYKKFITSGTALEGIAGFESVGEADFILLGGFYKIHQDLPIDDIKLEWYYGFGGYVLLGDATAIGPAGIVGLEYNLDNTRFSFFIDAIPSYLIADGGSDFDINGAAGVRYILN